MSLKIRCASLKFVLALAFACVALVDGKATAQTDEMITFAVNGIRPMTRLGPIQAETRRLETDDHSCVSNCRGEPTRTTYRIFYSVDAEKFEIVDAKVKCNGKACSWSNGGKAEHNKNSAWAVFDVWSKPTIWTLTIYQRPFEIIEGEVIQIDSDKVREGKTFIVEHDTSQYLDINLEVEIPEIGILRMHPSEPIKPYFVKLGESNFGSKVIYTILYRGARD